MRITAIVMLLLLPFAHSALAQCSFSFGADTVLFCDGGCAPLDAGSDWTSVVWSTGETTPAICAESQGWYVATVVDAFGCTAIDSVRVIKLVHTAFASEEEVCDGQEVNLTAQLHAELESLGAFNEVMYLPDGNGVNYATEILVEGMPAGSVYEGGSGSLEICATMEHSYLGDLEMMLTCPNGTSVNIFNSYTGNGLFPGGFGGGGMYLGQALDNGNGTPGVGWDYCFSDMSLWGTLEQGFETGNTVPSGGPTPGTAMAPGTYRPEESFNALIGCPLNGNWTLTIRDNIGVDDGYIMFWGIGISTNLGPVNYQWSTAMEGPAVTAPIHESDVWVDMTVQGVTCTDTVPFVVNPLPVISLGIWGSECNQSSGIIELLFGDSMSVFDLGNLNIPLPPEWLDPGLYSVTVFSPLGCAADTLIEIELNVDSVENIVGATVVFPNIDYTYSVPYNECLTYFWTIENGIIVSGQGTNEVTVFWNDSIYGWVSVNMSESRAFEQTVTLYVGSSTGMDELDSPSVTVAPNPFSSDFRVVSTASIRSIQVIDASGRVVFFLPEMNSHDSILRKGDLKAGVYWLRAETEQGTVTKRLVKQ